MAEETINIFLVAAAVAPGREKIDGNYANESNAKCWGVTSPIVQS